MLTIANKGRYVLKKCQKHVYVSCEGSLSKITNEKKDKALNM